MERKKIVNEYAINDLQRENVLRRISIQHDQYVSRQQNYNTWIERDKMMIEKYEELVTLSSARFRGGDISNADLLDDITKLNIARERLASHEVLLQQQRALYRNFIENNY